MAFAGGIDWTTVMAALHAWVVACTGLPAGSVLWGGQKKAPRPASPGITMHISEDDDFGEPWADTENNYLVFADKTITAVNTADDEITIEEHGLENGDGPVRLDLAGVAPGGLAEDTDYWVIVVDDDTIRLATSFVETGGLSGSGNPQTPIDITSAGSGAMLLVDTATTARVGEEITYLSRGMVQVTLAIQCHTNDGVGVDMAMALLNRIRARRLLPTPSAILDAANIGLVAVPRARVVRGTQDAILFEPRALLEVVLCLPSEDSELGPSVESVGITDEYRDETFEV